MKLTPLKRLTLPIPMPRRRNKKFFFLSACLYNPNILTFSPPPSLFISEKPIIQFGTSKDLPLCHVSINDDLDLIPDGSKASASGVQHNSPPDCHEILTRGSLPAGDVLFVAANKRIRCSGICELFIPLDLICLA